MKDAFIEGRRGSYALQALCAVAQVSDSGFAGLARERGPDEMAE